MTNLIRPRVQQRDVQQLSANSLPTRAVQALARHGSKRWGEDAGRRYKGQRRKWTDTVLLMLALWVLPPAALAQAVWQVSDGDSHIYLAGTIHLLRPSDHPLPQAYEHAYDNADRMFLETDIAAMGELAVQQRMLQQLTYSDGNTLRSVLEPELYQELAQYVERLSGLPMALMDAFRPGLLISTLSVLEFQRMGFTPEGVDAHFYERAVADGMPLEQLESVDTQIAVLAGMGQGYENEFIRYSLQDLDVIGDSIENLVRIWRAGDEEELEAEFVTSVREQSPSLYESLLAERNHAWIGRIEEMFSEPGTEYVLVGAAHMAGEDGLLTLLRERGYRVARL